MKLLPNLTLGIVLILIMPSAFSENTQTKYSYTLKDGVQLTIIEESFNLNRHKVTTCHEKTDTGEITDKTYVCKIDGLPFYGVGESPEPSTELDAINVLIRGRLYKLNTSQMYNAWGNFRSVPDNSIWVTCRKKSCSVKGIFSDATGIFAAEWRIQNGKSKRKLITADQSIVFQFIEESHSRKPINHHLSRTPNSAP